MAKKETKAPKKPAFDPVQFEKMAREAARKDCEADLKAAQKQKK